MSYLFLEIKLNSLQIVITLTIKTPLIEMSAQWNTVTKKSKQSYSKTPNHMSFNTRPDTRVSMFVQAPTKASIPFHELKTMGKMQDKSCTIYYHKTTGKYEIKANNETISKATKIQILKWYQELENENILQQQLEQKKENRRKQKHLSSLEVNNEHYPTLSTLSTTAPQTIWNNTIKLAGVKNSESLIKKTTEPTFTSESIVKKKHDSPSTVTKVTKSHTPSLVETISLNIQKQTYKRSTFLPETNYKETLDDDYDSGCEYSTEPQTHWDSDYESE